jgi:hypothetical protein
MISLGTAWSGMLFAFVIWNQLLVLSVGAQAAMSAVASAAHAPVSSGRSLK